MSLEFNTPKKLEFTPLEFETRTETIAANLASQLEFTPLEFETRLSYNVWC